MNDNERRTYEKFVRVRGFGQAHQSDFGAGSLGAQTFTGVGAVVTEIEGLGADEASAHGDARQGTETRAQARAALRVALEAIRDTARVLAIEILGLGDKLRLPRSNNDQELLNAGRAFHADATPLKAQFIAHELPEDFLEDLAARISSMEAAINNQASGVGNHVAASAAMDDAFSRGIDLVRKLDAIVRNKYADNPAVLAEWTSASHTERAPKRAKPEVTPPPPPHPAA